MTSITTVCLLLLMLVYLHPTTTTPHKKKKYIVPLVAENVGLVFPLSLKCILSRLPLVSFSLESWSQLSKRHCGEKRKSGNLPPAAANIKCSQTRAIGQCKLSLIIGVVVGWEESRWGSLNLGGSIGWMNGCTVVSSSSPYKQSTAVLIVLSLHSDASVGTHLYGWDVV